MSHWLKTLHPRHSLVARLSYAFAAVSLVLSVVLGYYAAESSRRQIEQDEGQRFVSEARDVIDVLDRGMFERYREMQVVAKLDDIRLPDVPVEKKREVLEGLQVHFDAYAWIGVCDLQGKGMVGTGKYLEGKDLSKRPWCAKGKEKPFVGDVHDALLLAKLLPNPSGQPFYLVDVAAPVTDLEGRSQGVLCGHIYWKWAEEALDSRKHDGLEIFLLNRDGLILAGPQGYRTDFAKLAPNTWRHLVNDKAQADHLLDTWQNGKRYLTGHAHDVGYRDYPGLGWIAVVRQDADVAFAPAKALQRRILLVGLALGVLFTLIGAWAARRISRPISRIAAAAEQVAAGDLAHEVPLAKGEDEVAHLSHAIHSMVRSLTGEIAERKRAEVQLRLSAVVFANNSEAIVITDAANNIVRVNAAFERISGFSEAEVLGKNPRLFASGRMSRQFYQDMWAELLQHDGWRGEIWNKRRNREVYPEWLILSLVRDEQGQVVNHIAIYSDITERKREEARIQFLASHDVLTGLPNRFLLTDRITQALAAAEHNQLRAGVMFIDLDHFKNINDSLGHDVGDDLLKQVAERMQRGLRRTDTLARLGGDEFVVLLPDVGSENEIAFVAEKLLEAFSSKFQIQDYQLSITPSLGISVYPEDGQDARELLRNADVAMYRAKKDGRNMFQFYRPEMTVNITERLHMEMQLRHAVENRELFVLYQPQICMTSGKIAGMEVLVRWQHPTLGLITPDRFIPVAEESGLIVEIGEWVLRQACMQGRIWQAQGYELVPIAVNVSGIQFSRGQFLEKLQRILAESQFPPQYLEIEITESVLMGLGASSLDMMHAIKALGVTLALDDFGTGYSSLSRLKLFPLDYLKIDQSFVRDIDSDPNDAAIVRAVISMAHEMHVRVIAEGVETDSQLHFLRDMACEKYQGYLASRPIPPTRLAEFLQRGTEPCPAGF